MIKAALGFLFGVVVVVGAIGVWIFYQIIQID